MILALFSSAHLYVCLFLLYQIASLKTKYNLSIKLRFLCFVIPSNKYDTTMKQQQ